MLGDLIGAGVKLLGGFLGQSSAEKQQEKQIALQREFAQSGIQWRVEDAKKAGVHPLYALGASTQSYSPVTVGTPLADSVSSMGQDLSRAINSTSTPTQRSSAFTASLQSLALERGALENQLLRSQLARMNQTSAPTIPSALQKWGVDGQAPTASLDTVQPSLPGTIIDDKGMARTGFTGTHKEPGSLADLGYVKTATGYAPVPGKDTKERIEDSLIPELAWAVRNMGFPTFQANMSPPFPAPEGQVWIYHPAKQEYQLRDDTRGRAFERVRSWYDGRR